MHAPLRSHGVVAAMTLASILSVGKTTIALAHHSFAMFDVNKTITISGTVKSFQFANPHVWVEVDVPDPTTQVVTTWTIEGASPNNLARMGWKRNSLKFADNVSVTIHPLKDGTNGGALITATVDGHQVGT
jgi:Family of unknown function (DUF6152)